MAGPPSAPGPARARPAGAATRILAVAGDPVAHSLSPAMHNAAMAALGLDARYVAARTTAAAFPALVRALLDAGGALNVTVPYKRLAAGLVREPTDAVLRTGACNTIWGEPGRPRGDNTDVIGARRAAVELLGARPVRRARLHGTGGSARAVAVALAEEYPGVAIEVVSRDAARAREFAAWAAGAGVRCAPAPPAAEQEAVDLLVNCTPLTDHLPAGPAGADCDPEREPARPRAFLDLNYRAGGTALVRAFRSLGVPAADGRAMLVAQGAAAFERFFGVPAPVEIMRRAVEDALRP